jgi:hypothetical protein
MGKGVSPVIDVEVDVRVDFRMPMVGDSVFGE